MTAAVIAAGIAALGVLLGVAGLLVYKPALERRASAHEEENRKLWTGMHDLYAAASRYAAQGNSEAARYFCTYIEGFVLTPEEKGKLDRG